MVKALFLSFKLVFAERMFCVGKWWFASFLPNIGAYIMVLFESYFFMILGLSYGRWIFLNLTLSQVHDFLLWHPITSKPPFRSHSLCSRVIMARFSLVISTMIRMRFSPLISRVTILHKRHVVRGLPLLSRVISPKDSPQRRGFCQFLCWEWDPQVASSLRYLYWSILQIRHVIGRAYYSRSKMTMMTAIMLYLYLVHFLIGELKYSRWLSLTRIVKDSLCE